MNRFVNKWLVCALALAMGSAAYAQVGKQIVKNGTRALGASSEFSILNSMDGWYNAGAAMKQSAAAAAAIEEAAQKAARKPYEKLPETREHAFRNSDFFKPILPTPVKELHVRLIHPTQDQVQKAVAAYQKVMGDFEPLRKEVSTKLLYKTFPLDEWYSLTPQERRVLILEISSVKGRIQKLRSVVFAQDPALAEAEEWLEKAMQYINPFYVPSMKNRTRTDNRVFDRKEFFLEYPRSLFSADEATAALRTAPANLRIAVLNDQEDILDMYRIWEKQNRLGEGWTVTTYKDTRELLHALQSGAVYDMIITDLTVPGGGGYYLADQVRDMRLNMPIIGCSMYTADKLDAQKMFDQGFDGYIYGDDMFEELAGSVSWMGYIKNYYYYKNSHGWSR